MKFEDYKKAKDLIAEVSKLKEVRSKLKATLEDAFDIHIGYGDPPPPGDKTRHEACMAALKKGEEVIDERLEIISEEFDQL